MRKISWGMSYHNDCLKLAITRGNHSDIKYHKAEIKAECERVQEELNTLKEKINQIQSEI